MSKSKQDLKDFASFFTNAAAEIERLEKDGAELRRVLAEQREKHRQLRIVVSTYEQLAKIFGTPELPRTLPIQVQQVMYL